MGQLKVVTYNINRGLSSVRKSEALDAIVRVLEDSRADVACLQEVWQHGHITENNLEKLTDKIWPHYVFNRNALFPLGVQGNAILSREHIRSWANVDVSVTGAERRGFIDARIRLDNWPAELVLICLHFGLREKERTFQTGRLIEHLERKVHPEAPLIVAGDFNDWTGTVHRRLVKGPRLVEAVQNRSGRPGRTFPAFFPILPLDRIYFRGFEVVEAGVLREAGWKGLSDHSPVYARFDPARVLADDKVIPAGPGPGGSRTRKGKG